MRRVWGAVLISGLILLSAVPATLAVGEQERGLPEGTHPDYIYDVQAFGVSLDPKEGTVRVIETAEFTSLSGSTTQLRVALPRKPVEVTTVGISCRDAGYGALRPIGLQYSKGMNSQGVLPLQLERAIQRWETCKLVMEYVDPSPATFRSYSQDEISFSEFTFLPVTEARTQELRVSLSLPRGWYVDSMRPFGSVDSGYRGVTLSWRRLGWGPGEPGAFFAKLTTRVEEETNTLPIMFALSGAGMLLAWASIAFSRRRADIVWRRRGGRLAQVYEQSTWAMRFSETVPLAAKNLTRKKGRTFLTFGGVAIAASMLSSQALTVALSAQEGGATNVEGYLYAVVAIALGVSFFAVASTTFTAVQERRSEVGVMKAVGFGSGWVMRLFVVEAVLLGLVAALVGGSVGLISALQPYTTVSLAWGPFWVFIAFDLGMAVLVGTLYVAKARAHLIAGMLVAGVLPLLGIFAQLSIVSRFPLSWAFTASILLACLIFILLVCLVGSLFPARLAARLYPVEALR